MIATLRFCLVLNNHQPIGNFDGVFEQAYQDSYLPFLDVFEQYPAELKMSLHTSGPLMEWLDQRHSDYLVGSVSFEFPLSKARMTRTRRTLIALAVVATPILAGGFVIQERATRDGVRLFEQVMSVVGERFVDSVGASGLYEKAARGQLRDLKDPYTELYSPKQLEAFNTTTGGFYGGVGMLIEEQEGNIIISKVYPHPPAEEAGIQEGDRIIQVDTSSTRGWRIDQVSSRLKGEPGTKVTAKFARPGWTEPITATFTRRTIRIPAVPFSIMLDAGLTRKRNTV